jgi:hypothetical protein
MLHCIIIFPASTQRKPVPKSSYPLLQNCHFLDIYQEHFLTSIKSQLVEDVELYIVNRKIMKIIARLLSLILSDMKSEDVYVLLIFVTLFLRVVWLTLDTFLSHAMQPFAYQHSRAQNQLADRLTLCH